MVERCCLGTALTNRWYWACDSCDVNRIKAEAHDLLGLQQLQRAVAWRAGEATAIWMDDGDDNDNNNNNNKNNNNSNNSSTWNQSLLDENDRCFQVILQFESLDCLVVIQVFVPVQMQLEENLRYFDGGNFTVPVAQRWMTSDGDKLYVMHYNEQNHTKPIYNL